MANDLEVDNWHMAGFKPVKIILLTLFSFFALILVGIVFVAWWEETHPVICNVNAFCDYYPPMKINTFEGNPYLLK